MENDRLYSTSNGKYICVRPVNWAANSFSINRGQIITDDVYPFITKNPLFDIDIDTIEDFNIAKKLI